MPSARAASSEAGTRSNPVTVWPARTRFAAIGPPMLPSPTKAMMLMNASPCLSFESVNRERRQVVPKVDSSAVEAVEHAEGRRELVVTYAGGARYAYAGVPAETFRALLAAESIGLFVNREIKPGYPARRLTGRRGRGR